MTRKRRGTQAQSPDDAVAGRRDRVSRERRINYTRLLGMGFCVAGFVAIGLAWNGMARVACVDCQLPYLLSGGATGIGLIVFGVGLLVIGQIRADRFVAELYLEEILAPALRAGAPLAPPGEEPPARNGQILVVAGSAAYHRPGCRLLRGKTGLASLSLDDARASGLAPCRVCNPLEQDAPEEALGERGDARQGRDDHDPAAGRRRR